MLFEFGRSYHQMHSDSEAVNVDEPVTKRYSEVQHLSLFLTGMRQRESWRAKQQEVDFYDLKSVVMRVLRYMRVNMQRVQMVPSEAHYFAEGVDMVFRDSKKIFCRMGRLAKETLKMMDCKQPVFYADIDWDLLLKCYPSTEVTYVEVAKYPEVRRDLALIIEQKVSFADIERVALSSEKKLLKAVNLFDVYEGKGIAQGMKSYAVSFILQDAERTLNDKQIEAVMAKIQKNLENQLQAKLRQ